MAMSIMSRMMIVILKVVGPMLLVGMSIGLIISIFQAATQIHEQTITFVPKLVAIGIILLIGGSYMTENMLDFVKYIFDMMLQI